MYKKVFVTNYTLDGYLRCHSIKKTPGTIRVKREEYTLHILSIWSIKVGKGYHF